MSWWSKTFAQYSMWSFSGHHVKGQGHYGKNLNKKLEYYTEFPTAYSDSLRVPNMCALFHSPGQKSKVKVTLETKLQPKA